MIALRKTAAAFGAELVRVAAPVLPASDSVIIDVVATGICSSDVHAYEWTPGYALTAGHFPLTISHALSSIVRTAGAAITDVTQDNRPFAGRPLPAPPARLACQGRPSVARNAGALDCTGTMTLPAARNCRPA